MEDKDKKEQSIRFNAYIHRQRLDGFQLSAAAGCYGKRKKRGAAKR
jgi:hypothetical protein